MVCSSIVYSISGYLGLGYYWAVLFGLVLFEPLLLSTVQCGLRLPLKSEPIPFELTTLPAQIELFTRAMTSQTQYIYRPRPALLILE